MIIEIQFRTGLVYLDKSYFFRNNASGSRVRGRSCSSVCRTDRSPSCSALWNYKEIVLKIEYSLGSLFRISILDKYIDYIKRDLIILIVSLIVEHITGN